MDRLAEHYAPQTVGAERSPGPLSGRLAPDCL